MDKHDRKTMTKELLEVGLYPELLDSLSDSHIQRLFELIGWAAPAFYRDQVERRKDGKKKDWKE